MKIKKYIYISGVGVGAVRLGGQCGCERRIEVIVEMQIKKSGGGGLVRSGRGWGVEGWVGVGRGGGWLGARLGVGGDVGYGGCEPRIEGIVQCT